MRGKFLHNQLIVAALAFALGRQGHRIWLEYPTRPGQRPPCVDVYAVVSGKRIVMEVECSVARIGNDFSKACELGADLLLIVVPNPNLRARVHSALNHLTAISAFRQIEVQVFTVGTALQWIETNCAPADSPGFNHGLKRIN